MTRTDDDCGNRRRRDLVLLASCDCEGRGRAVCCNDDIGIAYCQLFIVERSIKVMSIKYVWELCPSQRGHRE